MRGNRVQTYDRLVLIRTPLARPAPVPHTTSRPYPAKLSRIFLLLCLAFALLSGYAYWQYRTISSLNRRISWLSQKSAASAATHHHVGKTAVNELRTIICPLCRGEKFVVYGEDILHRKRQSCPVCLGAGYRTVEISPGHRICPDCHGMGIVYDPYDRWHTVRSADCGRCGAKGVVATFEQVAENAAK